MSHKSKYSGMSYSQAAQKINKKFKNKDSNAQEMKGWEFEMRELIKMQEQARLKELAIQSLKEYRQQVDASGYARKGKYETGGPLNLNPTGNYQDNRFVPQPIVSGLPTITNPFNTASPIQDSAPSPLSPREQTIKSYSKSSLTPGLAVGTNPMDNLSDGIYAPDRLPQLPIKPIVSGQVGTRTTPQVEPGVPGIQDKGAGNIYAPLAIGKGIEFAGKLAMLADGYDKVKPQYNPNESRVESLMANRSIDTAALENNALSQQNVALANLTDVRSPNVKRALVANAIQNTTRALQDTKLQENQMRNQYSSDYANTLNNLGTQRVQADVYAENLNTQSKSNYQQGLQNMLATVGNAGQRLTDYKTTVAQQELVTSMLSTKNFKAGSASAIQEKLRKGIPLEEGDFIQLYTSNGKSKEEALTDYNALMAKLYNK